MEAFGVHFLKEISRPQLQGAAKYLLSSESREKLTGCDKSAFIVPLAHTFVDREILLIKKKTRQKLQASAGRMWRSPPFNIDTP